MKALDRHQQTSQCSLSCVDAVFSKVSLLSVCGEQHLTALAAVWAVWEFPADPYGQNAIRYNSNPGSGSFIWLQEMFNSDSALPLFVDFI